MRLQERTNMPRSPRFLRPGRPGPQPAARRPAFRPALEALEDRQAPAVLTVTDPGDSGPGALRQAIMDANNEASHPGPDTIVFAPALAGATISLTTTDPAAADGPSAFAVSSTITIDGGD